MDKVLEIILPFLGANIGTIAATIAGLIGMIVYKDKADKNDAIASLKTGVAHFFQANPVIKNSLSDGKISRSEWKLIFNGVGNQAIRVATRGGAKVLKRWTGPVAEKYIEAVAREIAEEFKDSPENNYGI